MSKSDVDTYTGVERAAVLMLALGDERCARLLEMLHEDEIKEISTAMIGLGSVPAGNVNEAVLANYLKNEYPQTVAVILSRIKPDQTARVLALLPHTLAVDVVFRMLQMEGVQREVLDGVESTLRTEFMSNLARSTQRDAQAAMTQYRLNRRLKDRPGMRNCLIRAVKLAPDLLAVRLRLAEFFLEENDLRQARQHAKAALRIAPDDAGALRMVRKTSKEAVLS